ncbi:non-ribosomal peptide synthetase [Kitasatospora herbaricolor]|nr:non-ribosomal peptide synthetase [Kitasatospora herbaricolor]
MQQSIPQQTNPPQTDPPQAVPGHGGGPQHDRGPAATTPGALSPIQRAYLVGDQEGLELRGPARYYLGCDLDTARVPGIGDRLRRLVRANDVLRADVAGDLSVSTLPAEAAAGAGVDLRRVADADFDAANEEVRRRFSADDFAFDGRRQFEVVVVSSDLRARLHLVYALWLMDAASLGLFLAGLVRDEDETARTDAPPAARATPRRDRSERDRRFWRERAAALPDAAELPLRPDWRQAGPGVTHRMVTVEAPAAARLLRTAKAHGLTLPMVCLAAYGAVLGRLGGGTAHTVTVLHSRRTTPPAPDSLGNHGSTMPLEVPATDGQSFLELARAVQAQYLVQAVHGSLSGAEIARLADPGGDLRRLPHPFAFTALEVDGRREAELGLRRRWDEVRLRVPQVLIDHQVVVESDGRLRLGFDWRSDAFDPGFGEDFVDQYAGLVGQLAASEEHWTRVAAPAPGASPVMPPRTTVQELVHDRVLRVADGAPAAPAVHDADGTLTYAELAGRARTLAALLLDAGARPGDRVAVHLPRGRGQVIAVLGALIAGCVYIPLDHGTPEGRLDSIARRAGVRFAVTDDGTSGDGDGRWARRGATTVTLPAVADGRCRPAPAGAPAPDPTAYVIFTSGSTGEPKGVVISHAAVLNTLDAVNEELALGPADRVLSVSSIGFDLSVYDIFGPLLRGGSVLMLSEGTARDPAAWAELIDRHRVTIWNSAPALASLLAEEGAGTPSVRAFLLSGDWIPPTLPGALQLLSPNADMISLGGATEGAIWSIAHRIREADRAGRSIPYGRPLAGQDVLVLDGAREACADWQIGEIWIAGAGVADGYLNDPARTEAAFLADPVLGWVYRTGDRGRRHPDGVVEFLGRTDTQVKLNGHRVELGEVENLLEGAAGVRGCAACVRGEGRRRRVVAFVSLAPDAPAGWREDAYAALRDALPPYMVPDAVVELDAIPLTANGKVDRRQLERLPLDEAPADAAEPAGEVAAGGSGRSDPHRHEVARCWQEVLGTPPGRANFFESGGGSYDAIRLLSLLRGRYGYQVPFGDFMADPTAAGLATRCRRARASQDSGIWSFNPRAAAGPRLRLVLFPPVGGGVSCYSDLIRSLPGGVDVHVVGFDAPVAGPDGDPLTLAALARRCLERLPAPVMSDGVPLVLGGWSFGGALAFEAARVCSAPVERVLVVDTPVSAGSRDPGAVTTERLLDGFVRDVRATGGVAVDAGQVLADPTLGSRFEVYRQNMALLRDWEPVPCEVPVVEFRAGDGPAERVDGAWGRVARVEESHVLTGGHFDVFEGANLRLVSDAIKEVKQ